MTAPTWVLLRGWTRDARHWNDFAERLAAATPGARVVAVDLPGSGQAHAMRSPWTVQGIAGHVRESLRASGLEPPYALLAISMGGMVATAWAQGWPADIDSAVLINTSMRPFSPIAQRLLPRNAGRLLSVPFSPARAAERTILRLTSRARADDRPLLDRWVSHRRERPVRRVDALAQLVAAARFRAPRDNPFRQVLLLTSTRDALVDTRCTLALGRAWNCEVRSHPRAGHDLPLDDPDWVVTQVSSAGHAVITMPRQDAGS
jgi:pimeloyl-ACP methyl ester carboxylesterase